MNSFSDDVVYNQSAGGNSTMDKRRPDLRDELGYIAPPNRKLPPVPGSNYNTCDRIKRGTVISKDISTYLISVHGTQHVRLVLPSVAHLAILQTCNRVTVSMWSLCFELYQAIFTNEIHSTLSCFRKALGCIFCKIDCKLKQRRIG